jgi:hypothetical protein
LVPPGGHGTRIEGQGARNLRRVEPLIVLQVFALTKALVINQANTSQRRANTALLATSSSALGPAVCAPSSSPRAQTWERGRREATTPSGMRAWRA